MLVPIRVDITFDGVHFQDIFCWSAAESPRAADEFAQVLCQENGLPHTAVAAVVTAIQQQVHNCTTESSGQRSDLERLETIKYELRDAQSASSLSNASKSHAGSKLCPALLCCKISSPGMSTIHRLTQRLLPRLCARNLTWKEPSFHS